MVSARVIVALGSNWLPSAHIQWATSRLLSLLSDFQCSRTIWTKDIHGRDVYYLNRLVAGTINGNISASELIQRLKAIEAETHRDKQHVTIDLDLMLYNSQRFHEQDWPQPYIQQIINDIL